MKYLMGDSYDYDQDAKDFIRWISNSKLDDRYKMGYEIYTDDGSMGSTGEYISFDSDEFYIAIKDLFEMFCEIRK